MKSESEQQHEVEILSGDIVMPGPETMSFRIAPEEPIEIVKQKGDRITNRQAAMIADAIVRGTKSLREIAQEIGVSVQALRRSKVVNKAINEMRLLYHLSPAMQKELVRNARVRILLEALESGDRKMALKAADAIATDPEVGLTSKPASVSIDIGTLSDVTASINVPKEYLDAPSKDPAAPES